MARMEEVNGVRQLDGHDLLNGKYLQHLLLVAIINSKIGLIV